MSQTAVLRSLRGWIPTAALLAAAATPAGAAPAIQITSVPPYAVDGFVAGTVTGVDFGTHRVAPYIYIDGLGWFTKPSFATPTVAISGSGGFSADVATGGVDNRATIYCVALVESAVPPPAAGGALRIPASLSALAMDCEERYGTTLSFEGLPWAVREAPAAVGPNGNWFSDSASSVWVDAQGMHLKIRFDGVRWTAAEVILIDPASRGRYGLAHFQTDSRLDVLDERVTFAFFSWDPYGDGSAVQPSRELDFEDGRWGNAADPINAQFVVQPYTTAGNLARYTLPDLSADAALTRLLRWSPGRVVFTALEGHHPPAGFPPGALIHQFTYSEDPGSSHFVPDPGRVTLRFNLWLNGAAPLAPAAGQEVEIVITDFGFEPLREVPTLGGAGLLVLAGLLAVSLLCSRRAWSDGEGRRRQRPA